MPLVPRRLLSAVANPYTFVDHLGRLAGACPQDPETSAGERLFIGAEIDVDATKILKLPADAGQAISPKTDLVWRFSALPQPLVDTPHHRAVLRAGDVVPGDARTAKLVGKDFVEPAAALAEARAKAIAKWALAHEGEAPSFATEAEKAFVGATALDPEKPLAEQGAALAKALAQLCKAAVDALVAAEKAAAEPPAPKPAAPAAPAASAAPEAPVAPEISNEGGAAAGGDA